MIGSRLKRAREAGGYSLRELEAAIGEQVSAQAIGKYERNEMMPGSKVLMALAKALDVSPEYLLSEREIELAGVDFRKAPHASSKEEKAVEAAVMDHVERYLELEELFPRSLAQWSVPQKINFLVRNADDAECAADLLREEWTLGIDAIPSMAELLEEKGLKIIALDLSVNVSGSKAFVIRPNEDDAPVIVVNNNHNGERQRFTLAHELAHLVLRCADGVDEEKIADRFAGAFLMAREMLLRLVGTARSAISLGELAELKKIFKVSIASIVVRCHQVGALTRAAYGRVWGQIKALGWNSQNSSEPNKLDPEVPQRMERLCLRAVSEGAISISKAAELLRKSVFDFEKLFLGQGV